MGVLWWPQRGSPTVSPGDGVAAARSTFRPLGPREAALSGGPALDASHHPFPACPLGAFACVRKSGYPVGCDAADAGGGAGGRGTGAGGGAWVFGPP